MGSALLTTTTYRSQTTETRNHTGDGKILSGNPPDVPYGSQYFELIIPQKGTDEAEAPSANMEETVPLTERQACDENTGETECEIKDLLYIKSNNQALLS